MNFTNWHGTNMKYYGRLRVVTAIGMLALAVVSITAGCSPKAGEPTGGGSGSSGNAPVAKPGAQIGANNPAPGQPNHMSPEMQAQLQRYQSMGNGGGNAAPPKQ